jgi:multiple sugar transport system ATP-binding protein
MKDGWIQQVGEPLELYGNPANKFVAGFIGSPAMNFMDVTISEGPGPLRAQAPGVNLTIPIEAMDRLKPYAGQRVTLGVRPEDLHLATGDDPPGSVFDAVVDVVEPLGSEILLDLKAGPTLLVARVDPTVRVKVHEAVRLGVEAERLRFFDSKTEAAV